VTVVSSALKQFTLMRCLQPQTGSIISPSWLLQSLIRTRAGTPKEGWNCEAHRVLGFKVSLWNTRDPTATNRPSHFVMISFREYVGWSLTFQVLFCCKAVSMDPRRSAWSASMTSNAILLVSCWIVLANSVVHVEDKAPKSVER